MIEIGIGVLFICFGALAIIVARMIDEVMGLKEEADRSHKLYLDSLKKIRKETGETMSQYWSDLTAMSDLVRDIADVPPVKMGLQEQQDRVQMIKDLAKGNEPEFFIKREK